MRIKLYFFIACFFLPGFVSFSQTTQQKVSGFRKENEAKIIDEYIKFVSIPM